MTDSAAGSNEAARITGLLAALGNTADEVAQALRNKGVQGVRNTVRILNPIVRHAENFTLGRTVSMDVHEGKTLHYFDHDTQQLHKSPLPAAVIAFLQGFNRGDYSDLELPTRSK